MPKEIIWKAPEFQYYPKSVSWYGFSAVIAALVFIFAIWQKNFLFALFVVVAELAILSWAKRQPNILEFKIDNKGISIGETQFYSYAELAGFHIKENPAEASELILKTKSRLSPYVKINILDKDIPEMKNFLSRFLPEMEYQESLSDALSRMIGF